MKYHVFDYDCEHGDERTTKHEFTMKKNGNLSEFHSLVEELSNQKIIFNNIWIKALDQSAEAMLITDCDWTIIHHNISAEQLLKTDQLNGRSIYDFFQEKFRSNPHSSSHLKEKREELTHRHLTFINDKNHVSTIEASIHQVEHENQIFHLFLLHSLELAFHTWDQRFQTATTQASVGIFQLDDEWRCIYANRMCGELTGLNREQLKGVGWLSIVHPQDLDRLVHNIEQNMMSVDQVVSLEIQIPHPEEGSRWLMLTIARLPQNRSTKGYLGTFRNITDLVQTRETLAWVAQTDAVTQLWNRSSFIDQLQVVLENSKNSVLPLILDIDLDNFKQINEHYGSETGDRLLQSVAERLEAELPDEAVIARLEGDEFAIFLIQKPNASINDVILPINLENLLNQLRVPYEVSEQRIELGFSIGAHQVNSAKGISASDHLRYANYAMTQAKLSGGNQISYFNANVRPILSIKAAISSSLRQAIRNQEFYLQFEPIISLNSSHHLLGHEALLRWRNPRMGSIPTALFIPEMEEQGLFSELLPWTFQQATEHTNKILANQKPIKPLFCSINISARHLQNPEFLATARELMQDYRNPNLNFVLEITETSMIIDSEQCRILLQQLKEIGFKIALDDFGTGYSSLNYLREYPVDILKLDRVFVSELPENSRDQLIIQSTINLAHALGMTVVAEGVEKTNQLQTLQGFNCDAFQGYLSLTLPSAVEFK